jgi:putative DNA primase/helicase
MFELEGRAITEGLLPQLAEACERLHIGDLWRTLTTSCAEASPSGGLHVFYRVPDGVDKNTKLAQRLARDEELTDDERDLIAQGRRVPRGLIETRGEGGFVVVAPSTGAVHPTGKPYQFLAGNPSSIPTITGEQRDLLHIAARSLDQMPAPTPIPDVTVLDRTRTEGGISPGDDYNARGSWVNLLQDHGWTVVWGDTTRTYWRRPGKASGISAVTGGTEGDYFYAWTTSTVLPAEEAMSKWRVYAMLEHGSDFSAAAKKLKEDGFGQAPPPPTRKVFTTVSMGSAATDGSSALASDVEEQPANITGNIPGVSLQHSDDGNALALIDGYGQRIRYCPERGRWLHWTGNRWEWCPPGGGVVREYTKQIARSLPDGDPAALRHKQRSLGAIGTTAVLTQAATDNRIVVALDQLDARPYELNTPAGIVDLRTGQTTPADPTHLHTRITAAAPDPEADASRWINFLNDTFDGHDELPGYMQRLVGYSVTGVVRDHVLPFLFGGGANGKGVFLETMRAVLGDYATTAPSGFLMAKNYAGHETEIARLAGARMVVCSEINEGDRFDEAKVKQLTGGDALTARFMRQDHFTFLPTHKLWLMGNHQPSVTSGGYSFWRRLRIVPFVNTVPEAKRVDDLQGILAQKDGGAILHWIVTGAAAYFAGGLQEPESVRAATDEYAKEQDTVARFVADRCHVGGGDHVKVKVTTLREAYERWCVDEGDPPVKPRTLGMTLRTRFQVSDKRTNRDRFYTGITLLSDAEDPDDASPQSERRDLA